MGERGERTESKKKGGKGWEGGWRKREDLLPQRRNGIQAAAGKQNGEARLDFRERSTEPFRFCRVES